MITDDELRRTYSVQGFEYRDDLNRQTMRSEQQ